MPAKSKKASMNSEPEKKTAKFVVEEKTEEEPTKVTDDIKIFRIDSRYSDASGNRHEILGKAYQEAITWIKSQQ